MLGVDFFLVYFFLFLARPLGRVARPGMASLSSPELVDRYAPCGLFSSSFSTDDALHAHTKVVTPYAMKPMLLNPFLFN
jgi:hypothetical protein